MGNIATRFGQSRAIKAGRHPFLLQDGSCGAPMKIQLVGGVGDFGKFALLRHLMPGRRLAICLYLTGAKSEAKDHRHFDYVRRPEQFRHLAPELFDQLVEFVSVRCATGDPLTALQRSRVLENAIFLRHEVPRETSLRPTWADLLVNSVGDADLVFLDPDRGVQGNRLTNRHVALAEIAALRRKGRALIIGHHQSGRKAEVKYLADRMKSLGFEVVEVVRLRLAASYFLIILDQDEAMAEITATFIRKWGDRVKSYRF